MLWCIDYMNNKGQLRRHYCKTYKDIDSFKNYLERSKIETPYSCCARILFIERVNDDKTFCPYPG